MIYVAVKLLISAALIALVSETGKRLPAFGALIASLPLVSVLAMVWMHQEGMQSEPMAAHAEATFWYVLPSLPMFLLIPYMLRHGHAFYPSLAAGCLLTIALYIGARYLARYVGVEL